MPSSVVVGQSVVLTQTGWHRIVDLEPEAEILGIDGSGRSGFERIEVEILEEVDRIAFVGTEKTYAAFNTSSRVIDSQGTKFDIAEIVAKNLIGELRFETCLQTPKLDIDRTTAEKFSAEIGKLSVVDAVDYAVIPSATGQIDGLEDFTYLPGADQGEQGYLCVEYAAIARAMENQGLNFIRAFCRALLDDVRNGEMRCGAERSYFLLWYLTAHLESRDFAYDLSFDTLQHTFQLKVKEQPVGRRYMPGKGGTAFLRVGRDESYRIRWQERTWSPLCGGLILSG